MTRTILTVRKERQVQQTAAQTVTIQAGPICGKDDDEDYIGHLPLDSGDNWPLLMMRRPTRADEDEEDGDDYIGRFPLDSGDGWPLLCKYQERRRPTRGDEDDRGGGWIIIPKRPTHRPEEDDGNGQRPAILPRNPQTPAPAGAAVLMCMQSRAGGAVAWM